MTTAAEIAKNLNRGYIHTYLKRRKPDGSYDADWLDVTRFVDGGVSQISQRLDSQDFDVGVVTIGNMTIRFNNREGRFAEPWDCRSLWAAYETRHLSKIKVEAGYLDENNSKIPEVAFHGLIEDRGTRMDASDTVTVTVLSRESVFGLVTVPAGSLSSAALASDAIFNLCSRGEVVEHITVDLANINPANDIVIDSPSDFDARKLDQVLSDIMLLTNSVLYIDGDGTLIVRDREPSRRVKHTLRLRAADGLPDNVYGISGYNSGRQRVKNFWQWSGSAITAKSPAHNLKKFGVTKKVVSIQAVADADTRLSVLEALRDEWQYPKRELEVVTDYLANEVTFYDMVVCDIRPTLSPSPDGLMPVAGSCVAGEAVCPVFVSGLHFEPVIGFKILAITHDLSSFRTTLKLREKGNELHDGYIMQPLSKAIDVTFAGAPLDVDVAAYSMRAQLCKVEVLEVADDYATLSLGVQRPDNNTLRLNPGAFSGNVRLLIIEVEE